MISQLLLMGTNKLKTEHTRAIAVYQDENIKVSSLSKEIERLMKENNELHHSIIQVSESAKKIEIKYSHSDLSYKSEIEDLKFLVSSKDSKIKALEQQLNKTKDRITGYIKQSDKFSLGASIDMSHPLNDITKSKFNEPESKIADLEIANRKCAEELDKSEERIAILNAEIKKLKNSRSELEEVVRLQNEKIDTRDQEIQRLCKVYIEEPQINKLAQEYTLESANARIQKLNNQIDFLNKENQRLSQVIMEKDEVINTSERYKLERMALSQKYSDSQKEKNMLKNTIQDLESTIRDLQNKIDENNEMMIRKQLVPLSEVMKERQKRDELDDKIKQLETEVRQYRRTDEEKNHLLNATDSDKKLMAKRFEDILKENKELNDAVDQKLTELRQATKERDAFKSDSEFYKERQKQMEANYEKYKRMVDEISQEKEVTDDERSKHQKKVLSLEDELASTKREKSEITFELERVKRQKDQATNELDDIKQKTVKFRNELDTNSSTLSRVQILNESSQKRLELIEKEKEFIEGELNKKNREIVVKDKEIISLKRELECSQDSHNIMRSEHKILSDDLSDKLKELEIEQRKRRDLEKELFEYKQLKDKFSYIEEQIENIVRQKGEVEKDCIKHRNKVIELEGVISAKEKVIEESDKKYNEICRKLSEVERRGIKEDEKISIAYQYRDELEDKQQVINQMRIKETDLVEKAERLQGEVKKLRAELDLEKDRVKSYKDSKEKVDYELKETRKKLIDTEEQLVSGRNETIITEQQKNQASIEISDLNNQIKNLRRDKHNLNEDNAEIRKQMENMQSNITKQQNEIKKLESLIQTLEKSKEDLIYKLQNTTKERNSDERDKSVYVSEISSLKKNLVSKEAEIEELRFSIIELDQRNDMLQSQLDYKTEELYQIQNALESQDKVNSESKKRINILATKEESYERRLQEREREIEGLAKQLKNVSKELHEMKEIENIRVHDSNQLSNDVEILTRENQTAMEQIMKLSEEKEYFRIELENTAGRFKQMQQSVRATEIEKGDIQTSYKEVCAENQRFKDTVNKMNHQINELNQRIQALERDLHGAHIAIGEYEKNQEQLIYEIQQYDKNVSSLSTQLENVYQQLGHEREARDSLIQDHENQRSISFSLEASKEELQKHLIYLENERNLMINQNEELRRDLCMQRDRADYERSRYNDLEHILSRERLELHHHEKERESLMAENQRLQQSFRKSNSFMLHKSKDMSEYEEDGMVSITSSNRSYENRNKVNLQKVISQLEKEMENYDHSKV